MAFRFNINKSAKLSNQNIFVIEGVLEQGNIVTPCKGHLEGDDQFEIFIQSIALGGGYRPDANCMVLSIDDPGVSPDLLIHKTIVSEN